MRMWEEVILGFNYIFLLMCTMETQGALCIDYGNSVSSWRDLFHFLRIACIGACDAKNRPKEECGCTYNMYTVTE